MNAPTKSLLVAEDNHVLSDVLCFNLQRAGFDVVLAENGRVAIEQLQSRTFHLLITDFQMPEVNGEQLCRFVREQLGDQQLPILMCSAKGLELDVESLQNVYQVARVLYKPFSMREIVALTQQLTASPAMSR